MNIIVPIKVLADDQDIVVAADRSLDDSKAHRIVSTYDLNAIEAAVQLASAHADSKVVCVSVADAKADDSKLKKGILARGVDELVMIADDRFQQAPSDQEAHDDIRQAVNEVAANAAGVEVTAGAVAGDGVVKADTDTAHGEIPEEHRRFAQPNDDEADSTGSFRPAFEPGSVFELVSKGRLAAAEPKIEVNGYTSDQAKTTEDYTEQFAIANCEELLPFLAMNPLLYDDLYNWLEDQGKADIDAALENNEGYKSYRKAVGK